MSYNDDESKFNLSTYRTHIVDNNNMNNNNNNYYYSNNNNNRRKRYRSPDNNNIQLSNFNDVDASSRSSSNDRYKDNSNKYYTKSQNIPQQMKTKFINKKNYYGDNSYTDNRKQYIEGNNNNNDNYRIRQQSEKKSFQQYTTESKKEYNRVKNVKVFNSYMSSTTTTQQRGTSYSSSCSEEFRSKSDDVTSSSSKTIGESLKQNNVKYISKKHRHQQQQQESIINEEFDDTSYSRHTIYSTSNKQHYNNHQSNDQDQRYDSVVEDHYKYTSKNLKKGSHAPYNKYVQSLTKDNNNNNNNNWEAANKLNENQSFAYDDSNRRPNYRENLSSSVKEISSEENSKSHLHYRSKSPEILSTTISNSTKLPIVTSPNHSHNTDSSIQNNSYMNGNSSTTHENEEYSLIMAPPPKVVEVKHLDNNNDKNNVKSFENEKKPNVEVRLNNSIDEIRNHDDIVQSNVTTTTTTIPNNVLHYHQEIDKLTTSTSNNRANNSSANKTLGEVHSSLKRSEIMNFSSIKNGTIPKKKRKISLDNLINTNYQTTVDMNCIKKTDLMKQDKCDTNSKPLKEKSVNNEVTHPSTFDFPINDTAKISDISSYDIVSLKKKMKKQVKVIQLKEENISLLEEDATFVKVSIPTNLNKQQQNVKVEQSSVEEFHNVKKQGNSGVAYNEDIRVNKDISSADFLDQSMSKKLNKKWKATNDTSSNYTNVVKCSKDKLEVTADSDSVKTNNKSNNLNEKSIDVNFEKQQDVLKLITLKKDKKYRSMHQESIPDCTDPSLVTIGCRISIYWDGEDDYFDAIVTKERPDKKRRYRVRYDDGDKDWVNLSRERFRLINNNNKKSVNKSLHMDNNKSEVSNISNTKQAKKSTVSESKSFEAIAKNENETLDPLASSNHGKRNLKVVLESKLKPNFMNESTMPQATTDSKVRDYSKNSALMKKKKFKQSKANIDDDKEIKAWNQQSVPISLQVNDDDWVTAGIQRDSSDSETDDEEIMQFASKMFGISIPQTENLNNLKMNSNIVQNNIVSLYGSTAASYMYKQPDCTINEIDQKRKKEEARPLTSEEIRSILGDDGESNTLSHWVRRSSRQPSKSALNAPKVKSLIEKLKCNDTDMEVLKMKKYCSDPATPQIVLDTVLDALEENTNCEALYIQNFNLGMRDDQVLHLLKIMQRPSCRIWCLNIGETYNVQTTTWELFATGLKQTKVTHMYASEHTISTELKDEIRTTLRNNRKKHNMHNDPNNLDIIVQCTHCWWNPINAVSLRPYITRNGYERMLHDAEAQGLPGTMTEAIYLN